MIRKVTAKDRENFIGLLDEFYHSPAVLHPVPEAYYARTLDAILANSPYLDAFLIETEEGLAGYAQVSYSYSTEAGGLVAWIEELYVRPQFQGQGLGGAFFKQFIDEGKGRIARFRLEVEPDNAGAIRLYERLGFTELPYVQMYQEYKGSLG